MSRRAAAVILFQSPAVFSLFGVKRCFLPIQSPISLGNPLKRPRLHHFSTGSSCSSPRDDLDGLVDAEFGFLPNGESADRQDHQEGSISLKDFAFLHEAAAGDHEAHYEKSAGSGNFSEDAILIVNAIRACGSDFDHKTMETLRQFRGKLNESLVIEVLRLIKTPDLSLRFFIWAGRQIGYSHTDSVYDVLIEILGFDKKNRVPQDFLREIEQDDQEILERLLNVLVRKCCHNGFWNDALEELGRLKDFGYKPSKVTYNALLQVLLSADQLGPAFLVHKEMSDAGFGLNRFTIGCYAQSLCKAGRWVEAINIIEREDFTLDTVLSTQMISGLLEASLFEEAMSFLHRMRSNSYVPNVVTYQTLLSGFLKKKQLGWCKRIIKMMITEGCNPSPSLFNSLMHGYCSTKDYAYAYKLLKKMIACGCQPGYVTYNIFIGGVCGNKEFPSSELLELAEHAYEEMLNAGFVLNKINVGNFAQCLCHMGKFDKAFQIIKEMMGKGFAPDCNTYTKVIDVLCQASKLEEAFLLFQEMKKNDVVPDVYTYTILIDTFCKVGLIKQASRWFNEMQINGCTPNVVTYTALIHAYLKTKQVSKANELFKSMISMGCIPNVITYTALIDGLCKAGEIDGACHIYARMRGDLVEAQCLKMLFRQMTAKSCAPNFITYRILINHCCTAGLLDVAHKLLEEMKQTYWPRHISSYSNVIQGFSKKFITGNLERAMELHREIEGSLSGSSVANRKMYSSVIEGLCLSSQIEKAFDLYSKMITRGCVPELVTFSYLVKGLLMANKWEEGLQLLYCACHMVCSSLIPLINHYCNDFASQAIFQRCHHVISLEAGTSVPIYFTGEASTILNRKKEVKILLSKLNFMVEGDMMNFEHVWPILSNQLIRASKLMLKVLYAKQVTEYPSGLQSDAKCSYKLLVRISIVARQPKKAVGNQIRIKSFGIANEIIFYLDLWKPVTIVYAGDVALLLMTGNFHPRHNGQAVKAPTRALPAPIAHIVLLGMFANPVHHGRACDHAFVMAFIKCPPMIDNHVAPPLSSHARGGRLDVTSGGLNSKSSRYSVLQLLGAHRSVDELRSGLR
ncbi:hypothetical protein ZIOFF_035747 [Zingiber officinale]|uniref:Pentatricopeptide repeat-containing protein n=1 Tax=Zingiber officinale TaxID=94328 RepID=A0A8J5GH07_ZINOF|nr:hypothetical protein ZIOFF_035747 [Zingiber officinale]